jgi:hypothetical protein
VCQPFMHRSVEILRNVVLKDDGERDQTEVMDEVPLTKRVQLRVGRRISPAIAAFV